MTRRRLPRIAALSGPEAALAHHLDVPSPVPSGADALTWTLTLLDAGGVPLAESRATSPDFPVPLADIAQTHLDVVGLAQAGGWEPVPTADGGARYRAPVRATPPPV